ncbi:arsenate reductase (glutaredoxin) [Candidatus Marinamargulisbacteria bacterium SCGC AG-414-C22]|nr:arsenate reductase (glutaredoxin) [Candidatus Marinamargulisbacteria bacterium SCGC AG-414-C22]
MIQAIFYHNPRCSKSRQALALLHEHNIEPIVKLYLKEGLTHDEVVALAKKCNQTIHDICRKKENVLQTIPTSKLSDEQWVKLMVQHPILLERPIFVYKNKAVVGRPPERVLNLIKKT